MTALEVRDAEEVVTREREEVTLYGPQVVTRPHALIERLPLDVQARIACIEACASMSRGMLATAHELRSPGGDAL